MTDIVRACAQTLGVPMSSDLADRVKRHAMCEVSYHGEEKTVVGMHHTVWLPDGSGSLPEPIFTANNALEVAQLVVVAVNHERLPAEERMRREHEWEERLVEESMELARERDQAPED